MGMERSAQGVKGSTHCQQPSIEIAVVLVVLVALVALAVLPKAAVH